jgi:hypothetical protein
MLKVWVLSTRRGSERTGRPQWVYRGTGMSVLYSTDTTWQRAQVLVVVNLEQVHPPGGAVPTNNLFLQPGVEFWTMNTRISSSNEMGSS